MNHRHLTAWTLLFCLLFVPNMVFAAITDLSQTMSGGSLSLSSDASASFTPRIISSSDQTANTSVDLTISDTRGSGAGWTVTMTTTPLTTARVWKNISNAGSMEMTIGDGRYTGIYGQTDNDSPCMFTLSVTTPGAVGTADFNAANNSSQNAACVGSAGVPSVADEAALGGGTGVTLDMTGTVNTGDTFYILLDMYPDTDVSVACNSPVATSGTTDQLSVGACGAFTDAGANTLSNAMTLLTSTAGYRLGTYTQQLDLLTLTLYPNAVVGTYTGMLTFTIA